MIPSAKKYYLLIVIATFLITRPVVSEPTTTSATTPIHNSVEVNRLNDHFELAFSFEKQPQETNNDDANEQKHSQYLYVAHQNPEFGRAGELNNPQGVAVDDEGNLYIADTSNHRIQKYDGQGNLVSSWGKYGNGREEFNHPAGLTIFNNNLFVADQNNNRIQRTDLNGNFLGEYCSPTSNKDFAKPRDVAFDSKGNMYVADMERQHIHKLDQDGSHIAFFNQGCLSNLRGSNFSTVTLCEVSSVAVDSNDNVYAAYVGLKKVVKYDSTTGDVLGSFGEENEEQQQGQKTLMAIAIDSEDNIFVVDSGSNMVEIFHTSSSGSISYIGLFGKFSDPSCVAIGKDDHIYIANADRNHIEKFLLGPRSHSLA